MLPSILLRVRTRKGTIFPLFCTGEKGDIQLAEELIRQFDKSIQQQEKKKSLEKRIATKTPKTPVNLYILTMYSSRVPKFLQNLSGDLI